MEESQLLTAAPRAAAGKSPWVGREAELTLLHDLLGSVRRGEGGCVLVEGPPGIGKSALIGEAVRTAGAGEVLVLRGSADEFCVSLPFQLITEALRPVRGIDPLPEAGSLWGAGARNPLVAGLHEALARVERACAAQPVVLVASDLQWADEASLTVLGSLMRLTAQLPLLLVGELTTGSTRDEVHQLRRAITSRGAEVVPLGPLEPRETVLLAERLLGLPASPALRRLALETGGNPLYVRELTAALVREQRIGIREGHAHLLPGPDSAERLPGSLGAAIADRVGHMSKDTLEVLRAASLLGTTFEPAELAAVLGWPAGRVIEALDEATATGVLSDQGSAVAFHAPLLRQALYESMPAPVRGLRHRQTAQVLSEAGWPAEGVAAHLVRARTAPDEWTLAWLAASGTALLYRVPELALELLHRATDALDRGDERREPLEAVLAMAAFLRGRNHECETMAARVLAGTADPERAAEMTWILGYSLLHQARPAEAVEAVTAAAGRWRLPPVWEARLCALHGLILNAVAGGGDDGAVMPVLREAMDRGRALGDAQTIAYTANSMFAHLSRENAPEESRRCLEEGLAAAAGDPQLTDIHLILLCNSIHHWSSFDLLEQARDSAREARRLAVEAGTVRLGTVLVVTARFAYTVGAWDDAMADLEAAGELSDQPYVTILGYGVAALIKAQRGELDAARGYLGKVGDPDRMVPSAWLNSGSQWRARLTVADAEGDRDEALAILRRVLTEEFRAAVEDAYRLLAPSVRMALRLGERELAADLVAAAHAKAGQDDREVVRAVALQCRGLAEGDPDPLREALTYFRGATRVVEAAECAEDLSVVLAEAGEVEPAKAAMRQAAEGYLALGAAGDLDRADARWRDAGLRRGAHGARKRPATGWDSLTPTEQRIAELVAEGLSNPDIGERLYSSRRTIQTHVTHILAKLGLRSRGEVARAMANRPRSEAAG